MEMDLYHNFDLWRNCDLWRNHRGGQILQVSLSSGLRRELQRPPHYFELAAPICELNSYKLKQIWSSIEK